MIELEVNWVDYTPTTIPEKFTFVGKRNQVLTAWLRTTVGHVKRGPIKNDCQTFAFELSEDLDSFQEMLDSLNT